MYKNKRILALIPARAGSKRIKGKNIRLLLGKPLIAWTIEQAMKSKYIDEIIVSTEDEKIAGISRRHGAGVPFMRPRKLATDKAKGIDVVFHAIDWFRKNKDLYDIVVLLQPTSPLRRGIDIDNAIRFFFLKGASAIVSVCDVGYRPLWSNILPENGCMKNFIRKNHGKRETRGYHMINGAIYMAYFDYVKKHKGFYGNDTFAYIMPQERSVDIDTEVDFRIAECLLKTIK